MKLTFDDGVALVAGGTGGIGSAVVSALADAGLPVALTYHESKEKAEELVRFSGGKARVTAYRWSSAGYEDAARLVRGIRGELGPISHFVAASGIGQDAAFHTLGEEDLRRFIDTNLTAVIALTRAVITPMMKQGSGRIVLLGSVSGSRGIKGHTAYAATKAGLEGFVRPLAREAAMFGVRVNCVAPGFIDTPMLEKMPPRARKQWIARIPLGRLGQAREVASLIAFLLSEQSSYIAGQTLTVDGGISL